MSRLLIALSVVIALASAASATVTITLDAGTMPPDVACNETWVESGLTLAFVETTQDDCTTGACFFGLDADGVWLFPSRLVVDVSGLGGDGVTVEADVNDGCGTNCTRLHLYEGPNLVATTGNTGTGTQTLVATSGALPVDLIALSSCEGAVWEIRIETPSCPWDCGDPADGMVSVVDFLALLASWGQVDVPCDVDGGGVGVTDFLALLANWGPCP